MPLNISKKVPLTGIYRTVNFAIEDGQGHSSSDVGTLNISEEELDNSIQVAESLIHL